MQSAKCKIDGVRLPPSGREVSTACRLTEGAIGKSNSFFVKIRSWFAFIFLKDPIPTKRRPEHPRSPSASQMLGTSLPEGGNHPATLPLRGDETRSTTATPPLRVTLGGVYRFVCGRIISSPTRKRKNRRIRRVTARQMRTGLPFSGAERRDGRQKARAGGMFSNRSGGRPQAGGGGRQTARGSGGYAR